MFVSNPTSNIVNVNIPNRNYYASFPDRLFIRDKNISETPFNIVVLELENFNPIHTTDPECHPFEAHNTKTLAYRI